MKIFIKKMVSLVIMSLFALYSMTTYAGVVNPDCTPQKAVKGTVTKAAVGVGNRCDIKETATDTAKSAVGIESKSPADKAKDKAKDAVK